ncbi:MAG: acyl-CoA dehydrogenase [Alphaproteobacteria bacterium]|nr:acyl-CoA dehydrogenase [Alphaproteobacteria bacterium]
MSLRSRLLDTFKKALPKLSDTEKEALESGTVGWDAELMSGRPDWSQLFKYEKAELSAEEQAFLDGPCEKLCAILDNWEIQKENDLPEAAWKIIKDEGFLGLEIPKEYGGKGFSSKAHSAVVMKLASRSITAAVTVMVPNSLGPAELIHEYGTQQQKDYYLPRLANGQEIPCFALTGPDAGSDAGGLPDVGVVCKNEKGELGIKLNWEKRYITLGPIATLIGLAFKLEDPDNLLGKDKKDMGITVALVPRETPGVEIGERHMPMDLPFHNGPNKGHDVFIPLDNIIGGPERAGQGWRMLMESLAVGRSLSLPALSTAAAQLSTYASGAYSRTRRQFGTAISNFEGIEEPLARMGGLTYMMNAAREATLQMVDNGERPAIPSAILKYHLTEGMRTIVNDAMDIHGGKAISNGPNNLFSTLYKGVPVAITVEGANIMTRNLIIFGQGAVRAHPYVLKELAAAEEPDEKKSFRKLTGTLAAHVFNGVKSFAKSIVYGISGGRLSKVPKGVDKETKKYYRQINRLSASFNLVADTSLAVLGGGLKKMERTSARMGDVYSNMYLASTVLWYYEKQGRPKEDLPLVHWACQRCLNNAENALDDTLKNYPKKSVGMMLRPIVFPTGKHTAKPSDKLDRQVADIVRNPSELRDRLTKAIYKPGAGNQNDPLAKLEEAFRQSIATEPLEKKLSRAQRDGKFESANTRNQVLDNAKNAGVITEEEFATLKKADAIRREVIAVDSFPQAQPAGAEKKPEPAAPPKPPKGPKAA